jgi:hypothetical protein
VELDKLRIRREAQRRFDAENRPALSPPPVRPFADWIDQPIDPVRYRFDQLAPTNARVLLAAQFKAGKTSFVGNQIRALADREDFLNHFTVNTPADRIVVVDNELDEDMLRAWMRAQNIRNQKAIAEVVPLRGLVASFNILDDHIREQWARRLRDHGCDYLVLDCLRPVLDVCGLDESRDTGKFLLAFDELCSQAGVNDSTIVHHMGHSNERSRGDSRLLDWPDVLWKVVRETDDPASTRYFSAYGRGVNIPEGRLGYDPDTHHLTYVAGSRSDAKAEVAIPDVVAVLAEDALKGGEGISGRQIELATAESEHTRTVVREALKALVGRNLVLVVDGPKRSKLHRIAHPCDRCGYPLTAGQNDRHIDCSQHTAGVSP